MLSIGAMTAGQEEYYQNLSREDYYFGGGEPPGSWHGRGCGPIGLSGAVAKQALAQLFCGYSPDGVSLVQNAGKRNRQAGWDLTFSAPKSVSVLWSQLDERKQREIQAAHHHAVLAAIDHLERHYSFSRVGKGGAERVPVGLIAAIFEHSCSRALDMQLHSHVLVMNIGVDAKGVARSILSRPFYRAKMLAGAFYRCELARQLQERLGIDVERSESRRGKASWFEVKGIALQILAHFSKRREAILQELGERGLESASAAAFAALGTREPKCLVPPRSELHARWKEEGRRLGLTLDRVLGRRSAAPRREQERQFQAALEQATREVTFHQNYFTEQELLRRTLEISQENCLPAELVASGVASGLASRPEQFVSLGAVDGQVLWTTREVLAIESAFRDSVRALQVGRFAGVSDSTLERILQQPRGKGAERFQLDSEQQQAVRYLTQGAEKIKVVSGFAGTGKTEMLAATREALKQDGYRVVGTALAGVAARALQEKAGIESCTIRTLGRRLGWGTDPAGKDQAFQNHSKLTVDAKTVLIVDEAGMAGVRDMAALAQTVVEQGGSLIAVGDERQLSAIERPGAFEYLVDNVTGVSLTKIRRQSDVADRQAVQEIVQGSPETALGHYAAKGQFCVAQTKPQLEAELLADWVRHGGVKRPDEHRIFAATRAETGRLNQLCQWERVAAGAVDAAQRVEHRDQLLMAGDRVRFDIPAAALGIAKGERGTVLAVKNGFTGKYVSIALDRDPESLAKRCLDAAKHHALQLLREAVGRQAEKLSRCDSIVVVPLETLNPRAKPYQGLALDYAMTTHLAQGQTVTNSYVLLGSRMTSRELTYVQTSRHRDGLFLYTTEDQAGYALTAAARETRPLRSLVERRSPEIPRYSLLVNNMKRSESQRLASSILDASLSLEQEPDYAR